MLGNSRLRVLCMFSLFFAFLCPGQVVAVKAITLLPLGWSVVQTGACDMPLTAGVCHDGIAAASTPEPDSGDDQCRLGDLRCEYLRDPIGIGTNSPRLSWAMHSDRRRPARDAAGGREQGRHDQDHAGGLLYESRIRTERRARDTRTCAVGRQTA